MDEYCNDGSFINLYRNTQIGAWCAYGYSAYSLRLFIKSNGGYNNLRSFSEEMQMPCSITGDETLMPLLRYAIGVTTQTDSQIVIRVPDKINKDAYNKWVKKLKGGTTNDDDIIVVTPISQYVPKDRFIPDNMSAFSRNVKRIGDCILAFIALAIFSPLFFLCYIAIRLEDGGPAIFKQERIGPSCYMI